MRYIWQHIQTIIDSYNGGLPLARFLKNYFRLHPKLGSRDRRILSEMSYCWFRCSKALPNNIDLEQRLKACLFICETFVPQVLQFLPEQWQAKASLTMHDRVKTLRDEGYAFEPYKIGLSNVEFSGSFPHQPYLASMLQQPRLFIRVRKQMKRITDLLAENNIPFTAISEHCLSLPNAAPIDKILPAECYVVQDASSQATGAFFNPKPREEWWDCCSGAGGKSLLLKDIEPNIQLTVSDKRSSILHNLAERFKLYGHKPPMQQVIDMTDTSGISKALGNKKLDNIICDVPCTGSGTWARTPEQLYFFDEKLVEEFSERQKTIAASASEYLKSDGRLIYITCSIFRAENEDVVDDILKQTSLTLEIAQVINGIDQHADSMFIAVFKK